MSGEESLAQVNHKLEYPKYKNKDMIKSLMREYLKLPIYRAPKEGNKFLRGLIRNLYCAIILLSFQLWYGNMQLSNLIRMALKFKEASMKPGNAGRLSLEFEGI